MPTSPCHADFGVGWICALPLEMAAARAMLDEVYDDLPVQPNDSNAYILGKIGNHNIVIACLPSGQYGLASAATVAMQLLSTFQQVKFGLLVGIGGGIPSTEVDVRLGDVVVGLPSSSSTHGGVIQYDLGKAIQGGKFERTGMLDRPPPMLLTAVSKLRAIHQLERSKILMFMREIGNRYPGMREALTAYHHEDLLFEAYYRHDKPQPTCSACDLTRLVPRPRRTFKEPVIHYGLIASGNQVIRDSELRDQLGRELGACCVEMEAAGLINNYPCLVIRGICDYADSHKNKAWQEYAAAVAAAYAKELLLVISSTNLAAETNSVTGLSSCVNIARTPTNGPATTLKKRVLRSLWPSTMEVTNLAHVDINQSAWNQMFDNIDYDAWYRGQRADTHDGLVWIKGKPGSGKSSFLKHAYRRAVRDVPGAFVAGFFFRAKDESLCWDQLDLFRALLYQMFLTQDDGFPDFAKMFHHRLLVPEEALTWREEELKSFLSNFFAEFRPYRTILFVDGLDECNGNGMRELAFFFRDLTASARRSGTKLSICLSSREYPKVSMGQCLEIRIDQFNMDEIQSYVHQKLAMTGLSEHAHWLKLATSIIDKSAGVFLWVVLVLDTLLKDWDNGYNLRHLEKRLQETPLELEQVYERILSSVPKEDIQRTLKFFYWIVLSAKRLRLFE
ncbi:nucleoside phosphorylase domain-containing protein [Aspergillus pseudoustus]|uniref:Nucleoside phosphorylase domain-containing protein n=1 Tax=Aspergillus pseudoustus TaxID=1810923 RepID=A0ABR4J3N5_9EURO